jgi:sulfur-oxidizing protein SoxZ
MTARMLVNVPPKAARGEIIQVKTLVSHVMEPGFRASHNGRLLPRDIITLMTCIYNGEEIFRADFSPAVAANPFVTFYTTATESGTLDFKWTGDNGFSVTASAAITVE